MELVEFLDQHSGAVMAVLAAVYVVATVLIFWANYRAVQEMRAARIASLRPRLAVYLDSPDGGLAFLVIENRGASTAHRVRVRFPPDFGKRLDELHGEGAESSPFLGERILSLLERGSLVLAPGQSLYYGVFPVPGKYDRYKGLGEVEGEAIYDWEFGRAEREPFVLDFRSFEGTLLPPSEYRLFKEWKVEFEKMVQDLHSIEWRFREYVGRLVDRFAPAGGEYGSGERDSE